VGYPIVAMFKLSFMEQGFVDPGPQKKARYVFRLDRVNKLNDHSTRCQKESEPASFKTPMEFEGRRKRTCCLSAPGAARPAGCRRCSLNVGWRLWDDHD
jgi:hypothetical protein